MSWNAIKLTGVRQNNLKNIHVQFPHGKLTVVTGLSGSGKSSLVFDTLYAEGQRRYIESLSPYTRQFLEKMAKPDVDRIENIPPAIALEQRHHAAGPRSTVSSQTEIEHYLRLLFAKLGKTQCLRCQGSVQSIHASWILNWAQSWIPHRKALILAPFHLQKASLLQDALDFLKQQGFQRLWIADPIEQGEMLLLENFSPQALEKKNLFVVLDRVRTTDFQEDQAQILNSIEQALAIGQGKISFVDLSSSTSQSFTSGFACIQCGLPHHLPEPSLFSFQSPIGACPDCSGFGTTLHLDPEKIIPDPQKTLKNGAIDPLSKPSLAHLEKKLFRFLEDHGISIGTRYADLTEKAKKWIWEGDPNHPQFPGIQGCFEQLKRFTYKAPIRILIRRYQKQITCTSCEGLRLRPEARAVRIEDQSFMDILQGTIEETEIWLQKLKDPEKKKVQEAFRQLEKRLGFLNAIGLGYLTLNRLAKTLSGGESQRVHLATQLGHGLCGTLYVLDEPSIGLHPSDSQKLLKLLKKLRDQGNCVVVVEHDLEIIQAADWLIELGPQSGKEGGNLVIQGPPEALKQCPNSITGNYLRGMRLQRKAPPRTRAQHFLTLENCHAHNLKNITVHFPLNRLVVVTGVSGSGKSTLIHQLLYPALAHVLQATPQPKLALKKISGFQTLHEVALLDQSPIGKSSRSNPATYIKVWEEFRRIYANQRLAIERGYTPGHFSFNTNHGRCPECQGEGEITQDMHFMAEVKWTCEQCEGKRFKKALLDITYRGKNIDALLHTTVDEALILYHDHPLLCRKLSILKDVGLGYLPLGQPSSTLSGGESQRLKIAVTLDQKSKGTLYLFDEPTTGLHLEDIKKLMQVMHKLIDQGHSIIMIEHQIDVIAQADWIIDLGPAGGRQGGQIVAQDTPERLAQHPHSLTARALRA
jgi:excinuclease ABC subunit A